MPSDQRLSLLLSTLAQVALAVELRPTLQILLESSRWGDVCGQDD
jgi:hypothetical protein